MWTSALFGANNFRFFEIYGDSARTGGGRDADIFLERESVNFFADSMNFFLSTFAANIRVFRFLHLEYIKFSVCID